MRRRSRALLVGCGALALIAAGCGEEERTNELRPPSPIEVAVRVDDQRVAVAPKEFGAGLVNFTISNQSLDVVELTFDGAAATTTASDPAPGGVFTLDPVDPGSTGGGKVEFAEGEYEVTAGPDSTARPVRLVVGSERPSAQQDLLLP